MCPWNSALILEVLNFFAVYTVVHSLYWNQRWPLLLLLALSALYLRRMSISLPEISWFWAMNNLATHSLPGKWPCEPTEIIWHGFKSVTMKLFSHKHHSCNQVTLVFEEQLLPWLQVWVRFGNNWWTTHNWLVSIERWSDALIIIKTVKPYFRCGFQWWLQPTYAKRTCRQRPSNPYFMLSPKNSSCVLSSMW